MSAVMTNDTNVWLDGWSLDEPTIPETTSIEKLRQWAASKGLALQVNATNAQVMNHGKFVALYQLCASETTLKKTIKIGPPLWKMMLVSTTRYDNAIKNIVTAYERQGIKIGKIHRSFGVYHIEAEGNTTLMAALIDSLNAVASA